MSNTAATPAPEKQSAFGQAYWMLNSIEMFERLAYFGVRAVVPLYIMQAGEPGGLHLTAIHKGWIYMWWAILQSWLPMFTGGIADRYGYKNVLAGAITANAIGYVMMAFLTNYYGFFAGILVLATGTAFFKPALQGSIAQNLDKENSSLGWGIFYWVVNIGAFGAPFLATIILGTPHSAEGWRNLFLASAGYTLINLLLLLTFRDVPSGADKMEGFAKVFSRTIENIWPYWYVGGNWHPFRTWVGGIVAVAGVVTGILYPQIADALGMPGQQNIIGLTGAAAFLLGCLFATWLQGGTFQWQLRLPIFLAIMSCFWLMMYQLWDLHPNFITDWVDSSGAALWLKTNLDLFWEYGDRGNLQVPQQILLNLNAGLIIILIIPISWVASRMRTLSAMLIGMSVATVGVLISGLTPVVWFLLLGIVFFSLGEMWTGPKKNEYLGLIAPPGKKGLYLGYVNIPIGVGVGFGSLIAGIVYDGYGEKATLALKELGDQPAVLARGAQGIDWSDNLDYIPRLLELPRNDAFTTVAQDFASTDEAANALISIYRYDRGQTINLALIYLATQTDSRDAIPAKMSAHLNSLAKQLQETAEAPDVGDLSHLATSADQLTALAEEVGKNAAAAAAVGPGYFVDHLSTWIDRPRFEVVSAVRDHLNQEKTADEQLSLSQTEAFLWDTYRADPIVLNNLALEYLAQGTPRIANAIEAMSFDKPTEDIPEQTGIKRTKSFGALYLGHRAPDSELDAAIADITVASERKTDRVYVYLIQRDAIRFNAVARKDWTEDVAILRTMLADAPAAVAAAHEALGTAGDLDFDTLAADSNAVRAALDAKDWSATPEQAAYLLGMSAYEAHARAAAALNDAPLSSTTLLWEKYDPNIKVWVPFTAIGVIATIALGIFGQMAKRWKDMNA